MPKGFSVLEKNILKAKGVGAAFLKKMEKAGLRSRADFSTVGDVATLAQLVGLPEEVANEVMRWALERPPARGSGNVVIESADVVYCVHCQTKQPKDYKSGDLCSACGKQAEPILACYWCAASGPGKFCRQCGSLFISTGELDLAIQLKREGLAKDEIPTKLRAMSAAEREALWSRVRKYAVR
jgi:hypothetical protein